MLDVVAFCTENPGGTITAASLGNCSLTSVTTAGGNVSLTQPSGTCTTDGQPPNTSAVATLAGITDYSAVCFYSATSVRCTIQG